MAKAKRNTYPPTKTVKQTDDYHGTKVEDPYRWLEDFDSEPVKKWVAKQNKLTAKYLSDAPTRKSIRKRLESLWNFDRQWAPWFEGGRYFFTQHTGLDNHGVVMTTKSLSEKAEVLLDPNGFSKDGTVSLADWQYSVSPDGKLAAYGLNTSGSDWEEWRIRDIESKQDIPDVLSKIKFSRPDWTADSKGFFYCQYNPKPGSDPGNAKEFTNSLYYHKIGTSQTEDKLVYERPDHDEWDFFSVATDDGKYLLIFVLEGTSPKQRLFYKELDNDSDIVELIPDAVAGFSFIENEGSLFYFLTDLDAPNQRVVTIDLAKSKPGNLAITEIIPESKDAIQSASIVNDLFIINYLHDAASSVQVFDLTGKLVRKLDLPAIGEAEGFTGRREYKETFFELATFLAPPVVYRLDMESLEVTEFFRPKFAFNSDDYETKQIFYTSKDGTIVPMFVNHRKGLKLNGKNPCLLYGYGGFGVNLPPWMSVRSLPFMEQGGVWVVANIRGGGEYGNSWHEGGMLHNKQNVFDDFMSAAQCLINSGFTSRKKLAIMGGSNGGLLVGACITQKPSLFGAAIAEVGVMDMLRFQQFDAGKNWIPEYGTSDKKEDFPILHGYSPLHNVKKRDYPATLITTSDHDDRVVPCHSYKLLATLQKNQTSSNPILLRVEFDAGHGHGTPTNKIIDEGVDILSFLAKALKLKFKKRAFKKGLKSSRRSL